jgi:undecaprenyl-diphosphatase
MILLDELISLEVTAEFLSVFLVVIQLGSILAVLTLYFHKLNPLSPKKSREEKGSTVKLWLRVITATVPAGIAGLLFDDFIEEKLKGYPVVAAALILYGVAFIVIERLHKNKRASVTSVDDISYGRAFAVGCFQTLSLIPGTSRSGSTILGAMIAGTSRTAAAEFSFFLAIPVMLGASLLKIVKFGFSFTGAEIAILISGVASAFLVSVIAIKFLRGFVRRHSFEVFGWYRILLGIAVLVYFFISER